MKKRHISIILLIIMALSFTGGAFADNDDNIIDLSDIKNFEEIKKVLRTYPTSFKTKEDAKEFWSSYWTHAFPPKDSKYNYDLNLDAVLLKNVLYYGYGSLVPRGEQKHDRYGKALYLGYTKDGRYVTNIEFNENPMSNPKIIKDTTKYKGTKVKWSGKVRPYQTDYNKFKEVGELYLGKNASIPDKVNCGRSVLEQWAKNVVNRTPEFAGGKDFYTYFGGDLDKLLKAVTITVPPTSRNNGQAVVWFNTADGPTHRTYYIKPTEPVDIIAIQDGFKGTTIKPDGSISFTFDYKVNGLERVKGKTSVNYLLTVPDKYLLFDNYNKLAKELPKGSQISSFKTYVGISGIEMNIPVDIDWNLMDEYQTISFDFKTPIFNLEYDILNPIESIFMDKSGIQISGRNTLVGINIGHLDNFLKVFDDLKLTKGFKEYKEGAYENNILIGGLTKYGIELALLGRDFKGEHLDIGVPLEYRVKEDQKELDITLTAFKTWDITEDTKKTNVIIYDEEGKEITREEIELKGTTNFEEEMSKDLDIKLNIENLGKGEHKFYAVINSDLDLTKPEPITYEDVNMLDNNKVEIKVIMPGEEDFEIISDMIKIDINKNELEEVELKYIVNLDKTTEEIPTVVDLYKGDKLIDSIDIISKGGKSQEVIFKIPVNMLEEEINRIYGVVNADFNLKEARPYKDEDFLENNKFEILIDVKKEEVSGSCIFEGDSRKETYGRLVCSYWGGCSCIYSTIGTFNNATLEYKDYVMGSNLYRTDKQGQEYGRTNEIPKGKDLEGNPSYDELMAKIGYNPLYQVIQAGRGMQVKGVVRLTGKAQEFSNEKADQLIEDFVEDIKQNIFAGSKAKNNEGKEYQQMIEDSTRDTVYNVETVKVERFGSTSCKQIRRYTKTFEVEIPVIISKATGTIDVIGKNPKPKNPSENKYFVYLNTLNGVYQMKLKTDINPRTLGVSLPKTSCIIEPNEFKFAVYGTMFDLINTGEDTNPDWDN